MGIYIHVVSTKFDKALFLFIKKSLFHLVCSVFFKQKQSVCFNFAKVDVSEQPCQQRVFLEKKCHFNIIEDTSFSIRIFADTGVVVVLQCSFFFFLIGYLYFSALGVCVLA